MTANDIISEVRTLTQESNPNQRWSQDKLVPLVSQAQLLITREILWPPSYYVFNTQTGAQRYQVEEILETLQVYVAGQPIERSDIETMEGDQIYFWDQTGTGGGPGGFIELGKPPVLAGGMFTPQWSGATAQAYPVASSLSIDTNTAAPWTPGMRPRFFFDGGVIGLVPPPAGIYPVVMRCVRQPATITDPTKALTLPSIAQMAMTWKVIELMAFSNAEQPGASDQRNYALTEYEKEITKLRRWKRTYDGKLTKGPTLLTYRTFYARGNNRNWDGF